MDHNEKSQAAENQQMEMMQKQVAEAEARAKAAEKQAADEKEKAAKAAEEKEAAEKAAAEAEAKLQAMADNEKDAQTKPDTVRIKIPLERNSSNEDVQVFINGRQYIIQRGVEVDVPRGVAEILANKEKMLEVIDAFNKKHAQS